MGPYKQYLRDSKSAERGDVMTQRSVRATARERAKPGSARRLRFVFSEKKVSFQFSDGFRGRGNPQVRHTRAAEVFRP